VIEMSFYGMLINPEKDDVVYIYDRFPKYGSEEGITCDVVECLVERGLIYASMEHVLEGFGPLLEEEWGSKEAWLKHWDESGNGKRGEDVMVFVLEVCSTFQIRKNEIISEEDQPTEALLDPVEVEEPPSADVVGEAR
jgi:hypothetical protein